MTTLCNLSANQACHNRSWTISMILFVYVHFIGYGRKATTTKKELRVYDFCRSATLIGLSRIGSLIRRELCLHHEYIQNQTVHWWNLPTRTFNFARSCNTPNKSFGTGFWYKVLSTFLVFDNESLIHSLSTWHPSRCNVQGSTSTLKPGVWL